MKDVGLRTLLSAVFASACLAAFSAEPRPNKQPAPSDESQTKATKVVEEVYRSEYDAAKSPAQKSALALKLVNSAPSVGTDPVGRYVILRVARDIAAAAGDSSLVLRAIEETDRTFVVDLLDETARSLERCVPNLRSSDESKRLAREALSLIDRAIADSRFGVAKSLGNSALDAARRSRDNDLIKTVMDRNLEVEVADKEFAAIAPALAMLRVQLKDPDASLAVGRFRCFLQGDWQVGLPLLALGSDATLKSLAQKDLAEPRTADLQIELGDGWWALAGEEPGAKRRNLQLRAARWYRAALASASGLARIRLEKRLTEVGASAALPTLPAGAVLILSFEKKSLTSQGGKMLAKDSSGKNLHTELHGTSPGPGKAGDALQFDGTANFVLVPGLRDRLAQDLTGLTVAAWIRPARESMNEKLIFDVGTIARQAVKLALLRGARFGLPSSAGGKGLTAPFEYDGQWHHLAGTYDGARQTLYVDAQPVASEAVSGLVLNAQTIAAEEARIGSQAKTGPDQGKRFFEGSIDEVAVFSRGLNQQEIASLYQMGVKGKPLGE